MQRRSATAGAAVVFYPRLGKVFVLQLQCKRFETDFENCHGNHHEGIVEIVIHFNLRSWWMKGHRAAGKGESSEVSSEIGYQLLGSGLDDRGRTSMSTEIL